MKKNEKERKIPFFFKVTKSKHLRIEQLRWRVYLLVPNMASMAGLKDPCIKQSVILQLIKSPSITGANAMMLSRRASREFVATVVAIESWLIRQAFCTMLAF